MKLKKVLFSLLLVGSLGMNTIPAFADTITLEEGTTTATGSALTTMEVDASLIGGGIVVEIPTTLDLIYDAENEQYICNSTVSARGMIEDSQSLEVKVDTEVVYTHTTKEGVTATGTVVFGQDGVEVWDSAQMLNSMEVLDERDITIVVPLEELKYSGSYQSEMFFDISVVEN